MATAAPAEATRTTTYPRVVTLSPAAGPVSPAMRRAKRQALASHVTTGTAEETPGGTVTIACSCGMVLTNGPTWSLDEHIRLHRAEARYLALSAVAPAGMPRLIPVDEARLPV